MMLYRFLDAKYGLISIEDRRLKVSNIMELNDPFEFLGVDLSNREFRKAMKVMKDDMAKKTGIICFSKIWTNPLLWSHYADRHKGICLGFEVPEPRLSAIKYTESRLEHPPLPDDNNPVACMDFMMDVMSTKHKDWMDFMMVVISTKFKHWQYEQEYRIWVPLATKFVGLYYIGFEEAGLELREVIVGCESEITRAQVSNALGDLKGVNVFKSRADFKLFEVVKDEDKKWK